VLFISHGFVFSALRNDFLRSRAFVSERHFCFLLEGFDFMVACMPCNRFFDGFGFGTCRDKKLSVKVRIVCSRFRSVV